MRLTLFPVCLLLSACAVGPDYVRPEAVEALAENAEFTAPLAPVDEAENLPYGAWWQRLDDPVSEGLVDILLAENLNMQAAKARVEQASQRLAIARGGFWPSIGGEITGQRTRSPVLGGGGGGTSIGGITLPGLGGVSRDAIYNTNYSALLSTQWQLDLFGGVRRSVGVAQAALQAAEAEKDALIHSLIAETVARRVRIGVLVRNIELFTEITQSRQSTLEIVENRYEQGVEAASALEVALARESYSSTAAELPALKAELAQAEIELDALLGKTPGAVESMPNLAEFPPLPPELNTEIPAPLSLLDRRPDLKASEFRLMTANENIGVAIADLYPNLTFSGSYGGEGNRLAEAFSGGNIAWSVLGSITQRIFAGGRLRANIHLTEAEADEMAANYRQTVINAIGEVEAALRKEVLLREQVARLQENVEAARLANAFANRRYRTGIIPLLDLQETERLRLVSEQNYLSGVLGYWNNRIALYLALGGDWEAQQMPSLKPAFLLEEHHAL